MNAKEFTILLLILFCDGLCFANYQLFLEDKNPMSTLKSHLMQWVPILTAAIAFFIAGYLHKEDTIFANFGIIGSIFIIAPIGYVLGRKLFLREK